MNDQREAFHPGNNMVYISPRTRVNSPPIRPIVIRQLAAGASIPKMGTAGSAAYDLHACEDGMIAGLATGIVRLGIALEIPEGHVGLICSRSGLAAKQSVFVMNAPGVIDCDFRGEIKVILMNGSWRPFHYRAGDRIAQMMFIKYEKFAFDDTVSMSETARGEGGFGSTGVSSNL